MGFRKEVQGSLHAPNLPGTYPANAKRTLLWTFGASSERDVTCMKAWGSSVSVQHFDTIARVRYILSHMLPHSISLLVLLCISDILFCLPLLHSELLRGGIWDPTSRSALFSSAYPLRSLALSYWYVPFVKLPLFSSMPCRKIEHWITMVSFQLRFHSSAQPRSLTDVVPLVPAVSIGHCGVDRILTKMSQKDSGTCMNTMLDRFPFSPNLSSLYSPRAQLRGPFLFRVPPL